MSKFIENFLICLFLLCVYGSFLGADACYNTVYVIPMFTDLDDGESYGNFTEDFLRSCEYSRKDKYSQAALLLANYTTFTLCYFGSHDCGQLKIEDDFVTLTSNKNFSIEHHFASGLKEFGDGCVDNSIGIFLTNIPCPKFNLYPDITDLFGNMKATIERFNTRYFLQTTIVWLSSDANDPSLMECASLRNYNFSSKYDFLHLREMNYTDEKSAGGICGEEFPQIPHGTGLISPPKIRSVFPIIIIVVALIGLCLLVLLIFTIRAIYLHLKQVNRTNLN